MNILNIEILITIALWLITALFLKLSGLIFKQKIKYWQALLISIVPILISFLFNFFIGSILTSTLKIILSVLAWIINLALFFLLPIIVLKLPLKKGFLIGLVWLIFFWIFYFILSILTFFLGIVFY
jgi:hypothetical protein